MAHTSNPGYSGDRAQEDHSLRPGKYLKNTQHIKRAGGMAQVVEHLHHKSEALYSNQTPVCQKKKKEKKRKEKRKGRTEKKPIAFKSISTS
jgi:dihydroxyacid dehydratase/phosphogluconate dehydratase